MEDDEDYKKKSKTKNIEDTDKVNGVKLRTKNNSKQSKSKTKKTGKISVNNSTSGSVPVRKKQAESKIKVITIFKLS